MATEMQCITIPTYSDPSKYELLRLPRPSLTKPDEVLIKVHAASVNPIDVKQASGMLKLAVKDEFPYKIGFDSAGVVEEVGSDVKRLKVGDEVYTRLPDVTRGSWAEYAKCAEHYVALKPKSLSFSDAASLPLAAITAVQALKKYRPGIEGKTVFVPAGLGGTGAFACQIAKNVFKAGKVITTVSTAKVPKIPEYLGEGVVDQVIDYTKTDPATVIPKGSVDFIFDTTGQAMSFLSLVRPSTGMIVSISTSPSGTHLENSSLLRRPGNPKLPFLARWFLDGMDAVRRWRASRWGVEYEYLILEASAEELDLLTQAVERGQLRPVVGTRVKMSDIEKVKEACMQIYDGKGGVGKTVIEVI